MQLPLFRARYRVLVIRNADAVEAHEKVLAICLDQNLVGRGRDVPESLDDLRGTIWESLRDEWQQLLPSQPSDPEPELLQVFEDAAVPELDGDPVLGRYVLDLEVYPAAVGSRRKPAAGMHVTPRIVYQEAGSTLR